MSVDIVPTYGNQLAEVAPATGAVVEMSSRRSMAEVQAMAYMAKQFPRNQQKALSNILIACQRPKLAKDGCYEYSKGGKKIQGVSIRVAEVMAREWGNLQYGFIELERTETSITAQAYCWDMETNTRAERTVTIQTRMVYASKNNNVQEYERSLAEMVANQMQRRVRVCILAIIPSDVVEAAQEECLKTQRTSLRWDGQDGDARRRDDILRMVAAFEELGVTKKQIENRFQRNIDAIEPAQFMSLRGIYSSIKDGIATVDSYFEKELDEEPKKDSVSSNAIEKVTSRLKEKAARAKKGVTLDSEEPSEKELKMQEVANWAMSGCNEKADYEMAIQALQNFVNEGTLNPEWLNDAIETVKQVAAKNGITI